jgi:hypothetical protein
MDVSIELINAKRLSYESARISALEKKLAELTKENNELKFLLNECN